MKAMAHRTIDPIWDGKRIKMYRKYMGMKQFELAEQIGIQPSNLSHIEAGRQPANNYYAKVRELFEEWRAKETINLMERIELLQKL